MPAGSSEALPTPSPHRLQPNAPRSVTVSEAQAPPVIRAGLLQSTLILLPSEEKIATVFGGDTVDWVFDAGHVAEAGFISVGPKLANATTDRLAAQGRLIALFHRRIECVHINVHNLTRTKSGMCFVDRPLSVSRHCKARMNCSALENFPFRNAREGRVAEIDQITWLEKGEVGRTGFGEGLKKRVVPAGQGLVYRKQSLKS